ncbi:MAG: PAS domain S-box protein [Pseudomonadota bacterium]|nr:PAS domain S-box protein [Pseudomonadota bacterium]
MTANADSMLRALYSAAPVAVVMLDADNRIAGVNPAAARLFRQEERVLAGQRGDILFAVPREFDRMAATDFGLDDTRQTREFAARYTTRSGRTLDGETTASRITGDDGHPIGTLLIIRDITDERSLRARLEASDIQLRAALASANEGAFSLNLQTGLGSARGFINEFLGIGTADATIRLDQLLDTVVPEMRGEVSGAIDALRRTPDVPLEIVFQARRPDGEWRWLEMRGRVSEFTRDGSALRLSGVLADVTERRRLEDKLAERERQLTNAIEAGSCGVWELNAHARKIKLVGPIREILGLSRDTGDTDEQRLIERIRPEQRSAVLARVDALASGETDTFDVDYEVMDARTDRWIWLRSRGRRIDTPGSETVAAGIFTDITERKVLQSQLAANERLLREAVDSAKEGAWSVDLDARTLRATGLLANLLGITEPDEAVPASRWADAMPPEDREEGRALFLDMCATPERPPGAPPEPQSWEFRMLAPDGSVVWLRGSGQIVEWAPDGKATRIAGTVTNVTEERRLRSELDQSEARLREALAGAREGAWHFDLQTRVGDVTGIISEMMGLPPRDARITFDDWAERLHPDDVEGARETIEAMTRGGTDTIDAIARYRSETDGWIHIHIRGRVTEYAAGGRPRSADGFITDISERVRNEQKIQQRDQQLAEAVDAAAVGLWRHDFIADIIELRGSVAAELFSDQADGTLDIDALRERVHPDDIGTLAGIVAQHRAGEQTVIDTQYRLRDRNGAWVWYRVTGNIVDWGPDGTARAASGMIWNIDAAQRAEAELAERRERFERIYRATPAMMHTIDADGYIVEVSDYWLAHLGYRRDEVIGRKSAEFLDAESRQRAIEVNLPELFSTGVNTNLPYRFVRSDGSKVDVLLSSFLERDREGRPLRSYAVMTDVTALREAHEKLERSNEELDRFATVASHDLQEPLRKIAAFSGLTRRRYGEQLDEDGRRNLDFLVDAAHRMQRLIDDLLTYSRLASQPLERQPVDVSAVIARAMENLDAVIAESEARITVGEMPVVKADTVLLTQIFQNLIGNALKYRSYAIPEIDLSARRDGDRWIFAVSDNGIGLDVKFAEKIFAPFQRLHSHEAYPGTGIGLAMVRQSIERHGGDIWVESEPGSGATFLFTLPAERADSPSAVLPAADAAK